MTKQQLDSIKFARCLWKEPWWLFQTEPPPFTEEELSKDRDICKEDLGVSPLVQGRIILIRTAWVDEGGTPYMVPKDETLEEERHARIGRVLKIGEHAFPPSNAFGTNGRQIFCREGDWVEYLYWERTDSAIPKITGKTGVYYIKDSDVVSIVNPLDYPIYLKEKY